MIMMHAFTVAQILAFSGMVVAGRQSHRYLHPRAANGTTYTGIATFNDYAAQTNTVCGPKTGEDRPALQSLLPSTKVLTPQASLAPSEQQPATFRPTSAAAYALAASTPQSATAKTQ